MNSNSIFVPQSKTSSAGHKHLPPEQAPYLLYSGGNTNNGSSNYVFTFFSIRTGNCFHRHIPALCGRLFIGYQYGWIATVNRSCEPSLFNPVTEEEIILPSLTTLPNIRALYNADGLADGYFYCQDPPIFDRYGFEDLRGGLSFHKVVVSSKPSSSSHSFVVAALVGWPQYIAIAQAGQSNWILIDDEHYKDLSFYKDGSIICLTSKGAARTIKFDGAAGVTIEEIAPCLPRELTAGHKYIVHDDQGDLFQIEREFTIFDRPDAGVDTYSVQAFKLTVSDKEVKAWTPVNTLEGRAVLLGANAFAILSAKEVYGAIQPDCIYFTDDWWHVMTDEIQRGQRDLIVYNLRYDRIDRIICPMEQLLSRWPPPIWFY